MELRSAGNKRKGYFLIQVCMCLSVCMCACVCVSVCVCVCVCVSVCMCMCLSVCLFVLVSVCASVRMCTCYMCVHVSLCQSVLPVCPSVSMYLSIYLCVSEY